MSANDNNIIFEIVKKYKAEILAEWLEEQASNGIRQDLIKEQQLREECQEFLHLFSEAIEQGNLNNIQTPQWSQVRDLLASISRSRSHKGFSPSETASFIFSLKQPLFKHLRQELAQNSIELIDNICVITILLDKLGLWTTEIYQKTREEIILRQQEELLELSTPVVELWEGILALPIIGTLDSARTQTVMESLLQQIVETGAEIAIIDITGVPTVDTLTAQHLLKTVTAARLMGAECIISGIRPQIAQTIVYLGVDLADVVTKASLADAFALALRRMGLKIEQKKDASESEGRW
ncbi:STAS domain-containing protein [Gloeothece verrucosa]|uniref:Anti-sigma-factor antagonist n=1 Tax=Gloeothece verrucosa (strain PCC 7822) TaxID=497965 RepID=E0UGQ2_GLOV7|nr:STAS domain-containing protein [Gloeothece verrucosa]ADN13261.1 anti-sigma-factor antagonist [Gloeothece verrucosa PCC 7822]